MAWRLSEIATSSQLGPLKFRTGAEVGDTLVLDQNAVPMGPYGRRLAREGTLLTKITDSGKYGVYDPDATDGRQTITQGSAYILWGDHDVVLGDKAVPGLFHNCVFDTSKLTIGDKYGWYTETTLPGAVSDAFPTCTFDD